METFTLSLGGTTMVRTQVVNRLVLQIKTRYYFELTFALVAIWPLAVLSSLRKQKTVQGPMAFSKEYVDVFWPALHEHMRKDPGLTIGEFEAIGKRLPLH